jgi:hypothetical protein
LSVLSIEPDFLGLVSTDYRSRLDRLVRNHYKRSQRAEVPKAWPVLN